MIATPEQASSAGRVQLDRTVYQLTFDDGPLAGVVVQMRQPTAGGHIDLVMAKATTGGEPDPDKALAGDAAHADALYRTYRAFAGALLEWNIEDRGEQVPATLDGVLSLELEHATLLVGTWMVRVAQAEQRREEAEAELHLPVEVAG